MAQRLYICATVHDRDNQRCFPAIENYTNPYRVVAERNRDWRLNTSRLLVLAEVTPGEHTAATADPRIVHVPIEKAVGQIAGDDDLVSDLTAQQRNAIVTRLQAIGIDLSDINGTWTIKQALRAIVQRIHALQALEPAPEAGAGALQ